MIKIYGFNTYNLVKVLLTAEELKLDYNYIQLNPANGEHKSPEHLQRHPLGKIPAIEHNGKMLFESNSICRYLATFKDSGKNSGLYTGDAWQKAQIDQWIDFMTQHIGRWLAVFYFQRVIKPRFSKNPENKESLDEAAGFLAQQIPVIEKQLGDSNFLATDQFTLADIITFSYFHTHEDTNFDLSAYSNLMNWYQAIKQRPSYEKAMAHFPA